MGIKNKLKKKHINNIAVIGGGRWARVILNSLVSLVGTDIKLSVHTPSNKLGISKWLTESGLIKQVKVYSSLPVFNKNELSLVIIVNAAHKHEDTIRWALANNYHVLIEKPFCTELEGAINVTELASSKNLFLATAHVFLFANYIQTFSKLVNLMGEIQQVDISWSDPASEKRYGDAKSYDASLPIYLDWLPHINSILNTFLDNNSKVNKNFSLSNGGSKIKLNSTYGTVKCKIHLQRNHDIRQRIFEVRSANNKIKLDLSEEPGSIHFNGKIICDLDWENRPKPVKLMLKAFIQSILEDELDLRLNNTIGLSAIKLSDDVKFLYEKSLENWLNEKKNLFGHTMNNHLRYAITELIGVENREAFTTIEQQVDYVFRNVSDHILNSLGQNKEDVKDIVSKFIHQSKRLKLTTHNG